MLTRACLGALRCTPACMSGIGLAKHSGFVIGSYPHSLFYFRRRFSGLRATCKLPASSSGSHTPLLLRTCSASASTATVRDATRTEQNNVTKFVHSLSEEQAAAALAGDGHLRYPSLSFSKELHKQLYTSALTNKFFLQQLFSAPDQLLQCLPLQQSGCAQKPYHFRDCVAFCSF